MNGFWLISIKTVRFTTGTKSPVPAFLTPVFRPVPAKNIRKVIYRLPQLHGFVPNGDRIDKLRGQG